VNLCKVIVYASLFLSLQCGAAPLNKEIYHLNEKMERDIGFARAVKVDNILYVSGSVGWGKMTEAIDIAYKRIEKTLKAHGLDFKHVVSERVYTTDIEALKEAKEQRKKYFTEGYPSSTWVQIDQLFNPDLVIEVEMVAHFPGSG
jgi:enamine deaminase RidA (YjgF/YER057c/UK114 family)